jgi:cell division protein ZapA
MASLATEINGKEYLLACEDGQEGHLKKLVHEVDSRARQLSKHFGGKAPEPTLLLYTALMLADEMAEGKKEVEHLKISAPQNGDEAKLLAMQDELGGHLLELSRRIDAIAEELEHA